MATLGRAISIASQAFEGITDKGGNPYILHCLWVMNQVRHLGHTYMIVAVLHDLIEDTDWTSSALLKEGFSMEVVLAISTLTKQPNVAYDTYIKNIALNDIARQVKLRDLEHNTKVTRLKGLSMKDFNRLEKYLKSYTYLKEV